MGTRRSYTQQRVQNRTPCFSGISFCFNVLRIFDWAKANLALATVEGAEEENGQALCISWRGKALQDREITGSAKANAEFFKIGKRHRTSNKIPNIERVIYFSGM